uniref:zinc finger domain-containing protein n=1 Tax=Neotabrizicola shimadae TaxID=2807096 RepID=UPI0035C6E216
MARRCVSTAALPWPSGASQVRCTPCKAPAPSVTAAISAGRGMLLVWPSSRCQHFGWKRKALTLPPRVMPRERR